MVVMILFNVLHKFPYHKQKELRSAGRNARRKNLVARAGTEGTADGRHIDVHKHVHRVRAANGKMNVLSPDQRPSPEGALATH